MEAGQEGISAVLEVCETGTVGIVVVERLVLRNGRTVYDHRGGWRNGGTKREDYQGKEDGQ